MHTADPRSSLWHATAGPAPDMPVLAGDRTSDLLVIGGGYTGLSAALHAAEGGADTVLVEAEEPGFGAAGRNNGQVIPAYARHNPDDIVRLLGAERGERLNAWVAGSADLVFDLIRRHAIDCDAVQEGWLQPAHAPGRVAVVRTKFEQWAKRGAPVELLDGARSAEMTGSVFYRHGAWLHRSGGHIQPLSYARGLARAAMAAGAAVYRGSPALRIERAGGRWRVATPAGSVSADQVVIATDAYTGAIWPSLRRSFVPVRSFQVATRPLGPNLVRTVLPGGQGLSDTRQALWAFRLDRDGRLVTTGAPLLPHGARAVLRRTTLERLRRVFPQIGDIEPEYVWEGQIGMTVDRLPRYHELAEGVHAGLGYSGRGIALATAMGRLLADRALGRITVADMPVAPTPVKRLPLHSVLVPLSRMAIPYYRWRDARA